MAVPISPISQEDLYLFHEGSNFRSYQLLGAHVLTENGKQGVRFAVWAPNAQGVRVVGDFNAWQGEGHKMNRVGESGVWLLFIPDLMAGDIYKYEIQTAGGQTLMKADPYAFYAQLRPETASVVYNLNSYQWKDTKCQSRKSKPVNQQPLLIYEVHLGSWRRGADNAVLTYRELAELLPQYASAMGYTHIEIMPVAEHPFDGSWGYQATGYYAITSRYGTPEDFMYLVDVCHEYEIGVIVDWVPGHFCKDDHGLRQFDGTALYEYADAQRAENKGWGTANFDLGRTEVLSFLISNAVFWLDVYHIDGIRVDAVSNILYLNYGREAGDWTPNQYGGDGNLEGAAFLRKLNEVVFAQRPNVLMMAEESTSWPMVSWPTYSGGLGFNFKWNMGWMNDMLRYMEIDPVHRKWNHHLLTFSFMYAFSENFILPLSHDEVVHGKKSMLNKMPGDYWQKFANLRAFYGYWMAHPGKKLLFMGSEFGQFIEWQDHESLDWHLVESPMHEKLQEYCRRLNHFYKKERSLWVVDGNWQGFEWIDCSDYTQSVICFMRKTANPEETLLVVCNFTPNVHQAYRIGVPAEGSYLEIFNSDWEEFGGSGQKNTGVLAAEETAWHNHSHSLAITLPPLATIYLKKTEK
ncbi:1,4-alpha-glucan branching protein GlgB [Pelosinus fermentans]|uniref:1,4-alpha-glucan branching enzyme GlgB n=2 Tax=Pelosinus TaxID=365348 RepID=I9L6F8_9FIRM|nr:1,4-alpha-glucan branching protein GlgB [Pelosinus fermentans]EIW15806.1 1,4-alpha-glucan branching enzyme [Pelosinus fermentans B4]EIW27488.1 1,4-alpha-glucan-branching enzyme [Pelosinus fermentans A11]OAM92554.1 1,4-alpha-glucan-branching enzyme [Pelosinus fermentans DSM 17108]SDQ48725.1 1,4-alpha-glucan branching enzyme [Pelosinus fermentans]